MRNLFEPKIKVDVDHKMSSGWTSWFKEPLGMAAAAFVSIVGVQSAIELSEDEEKEGPYAEVNRAFCSDPTRSPPYLSYKSVPFRIDWDNADKFNVQTFTYDFNVITQSNQPDNTIEGFVASIPQSVRDDPDMFLVVTGHASRESKENEDEVLPYNHYRGRYENERISAQRAENNRKIAQGRLDHFTAVLDWPEGRLRSQNLETKHDKREVNIQLCNLAEPE